MPFNGNGTFIRQYSWTNDAAANIPIRADRMDNETNGIATGLSNCVTKDGQTTISANLPMAGFRHLNVSDAVTKTEYYTLNQAMNSFGLFPSSVGGTGNDITLGYSPTYTTIGAGVRGSFVATADNTGAATLAIDGITAKAFTKFGTNPLITGDITIGQVVEWEYDGTQYQILNPNVSTVAASKVSKTGDSMTGALNFAKSTDIASATTTDLSTSTGNYVTITGTTTITGFGTLQAGSTRFIRFSGALTLTYNASSMILPTAANILTEAGDTCIAISEGSGNWRIVNYQRFSTIQKVIQRANFQTGSFATGTTQIPADDTIPQITEGDEYMTLSFTPKSATSILVIEAVAFLSNSAQGSMAVSLFQDANVNALKTSAAILSAAFIATIPLLHTMVSGTTSATTFRIRAGLSSGGTTTFNGQSGGRLYGGTSGSSITITEYAP